MRCKRTNDSRKLSHEALEEMRKRAVERVLEGESPEVVARVLGINRRTMYRWLNTYHYGGWEALNAKPLEGRPPKLNSQQMARLARLLRKNPLQLKFSFALWTIAMIREVIRTTFDVSLSEVSVGRVLKTLGFTPQRPLHRAWQQDPALVERWTKEEYPKIKALAKRQKAQIFFGDEAGIRSDHHSGTTWAPQGKTPVVKSTGARFGLNMISAISSSGELRFMVVDGSVTASVFVTFLKRLLEGSTRPIFLILDGHPVHKSKAVKVFVESTAGMLRLFLLPPYSPELNADELVWAHVKGRVGRKTVATKDDLKRVIISTLRSLQRSTQKVANFFLTPTCTYAVS